jgi:endonuclease YncB( thermonuclease family)
MKLLGSLTGPTNIAAWVIAAGLALSWQYYSKKRDNGGAFTAAEMDAWNSKRKAAAAIPGAAEVPSTGPRPER